MSFIIEPKQKPRRLQWNRRITIEDANRFDDVFAAVSKHQKILKAELMREAINEGLKVIENRCLALEALSN
jgi:predicted DNA-binding protein